MAEETAPNHVNNGEGGVSTGDTNALADAATVAGVVDTAMNDVDAGEVDVDTGEVDAGFRGKNAVADTKTTAGTGSAHCGIHTTGKGSTKKTAGNKEKE